VYLAGVGISPWILPLTIHRTSVTSWNKGKVARMTDSPSGMTRESLTLGDLLVEQPRSMDVMYLCRFLI